MGCEAARLIFTSIVIREIVKHRTKRIFVSFLFEVLSHTFYNLNFLGFAIFSKDIRSLFFGYLKLTQHKFLGFFHHLHEISDQ